MLLRTPALTRRFTHLGLLCLVTSLACKPEPTPTTNPDPVVADPGGPTGSTTGDAVDAADPDTTEDPAEAPVETDDHDEGDEAGETTTVANAGDGEAPTAESPAAETPAAETNEAKAREPLPKPMFALSGPKCQQSFAVGSKVKGFRLPSMESGKTISSTGYRNRVVLINFWGTWCKPCLKELPEFDRLYRKYRKHGFTLVAVATDEEPEPVQAFVDKHKLKAKIALSGEEAAGAYGRPSFPFSVLVDGSGKVVAAYDYIDDGCMGDLEQVIRDELEKLDR